MKNINIGVNEVNDIKLVDLIRMLKFNLFKIICVHPKTEVTYYELLEFDTLKICYNKYNDILLNFNIINAVDGYLYIEKEL